MEENFLADKPINEGKEDKFQRYSFSKRIAETIINRTSKDSIVLGLYGAWGEGKTSVLNLIRQELKPFYPNVIYFTFNPWRFPDETSLLTSFFNTLGNELKKSLANDKNNANDKSWFGKKKGSLKTSSETIGEIIQDYAKAASIIGVGELAETIGKAISSIDIETLKERVENLLIENKRRIVVFIDDIDRLEKNEIHAIFRLVKLTGDFAYTTYLLSFDENMVSSAIGERFGAGDQKAGMNFLEKIIQIPIKLPLAQKSSLNNYCFELIEKALVSSQITLLKEEEEEFTRKFTSNFLVRLNTPRLAVRYSNTISFSLPLLKGEVNYVDLMLIEGVRVFYPELYDFVREQPQYFIESYNNALSKPNERKINNFKEIFNKKTIHYSSDEIANAQGALQDLFPSLRKAWGNDWYGEEDSETLYNNKRIATTQYFNRYFSYTVIEGDVSDVAFDQLLEIIYQDDNEKSIDETIKLIKLSKLENFIQKIRSKEKTFNSSNSIAIIKVFSLLGEIFHNKANTFFRSNTPNSQVAIFISQLIRTQIAETEKFTTVEWIIENAFPFEFAYKIFNYCRNQDGVKELFAFEQFIQLAEKLIERAKILSGEKPFWENYTFESKYMFHIWSNHSNKQSLLDYVKHHLEINPSSVIALLKVFTPYIAYGTDLSHYYSDFNKDSYDWIEQTFDIEYIYTKVEEVIGVNLSEIDEYKQLDSKQTDENLMRQFAYWYNQRETNLTEENIE